MSKIRSRFFPLAFLAAKTTIKALDLTGHAGGTLPGAIAEAIDPAFLGDIAKPDQVVFISGTNGKTTTNNLLNDLLADNGYHTVTNRVGGNISSGFASSFARNATFGGKVKSKLAVMEFDELSGPRIFPFFQPDILAVTNLFRDTFSRSATPDFVFDVMNTGIPSGTHLILNADDMISCRLAPQCEHRTYFSVAHLAEDTQEPVGIVSDLTACPLCGGKLRWDYAHLRHLGRATCESCGFTNPKPDYEVISVDRSQHLFTVRENSAPGAPTYTYTLNSYSIVNLYNLLTCIVVAREMGLTPEQIAASLAHGINITESRYNEIDYRGHRLISMASKGENDTATSVTLDILRRQPGDKAIIIMIADAYMAKAKDQTEYIGWYYQTDFEVLQDPSVEQVILYGDTSLDLLVRLRFAGIDPKKTFVASTPEETADLVDLNKVQHVFYAHGLYNGGIADVSRQKILDRLKNMEALHE